MSLPPGQVPGLVARAAAGDRAAIVELLKRYRPRLRRMVALRLDPRLRGRVGASDVIQEALNRMDPLNREIPVLRHCEQMTNGDAAAD
jgi:DNA-directed RNA polymerase specialized sigma24 family protein